MFVGEDQPDGCTRSALLAGSSCLDLGYGRFMETDPLGYDDGLNWYNYVGSDPVNLTDPTGTKSKVTITSWKANGDGTFSWTASNGMSGTWDPSGGPNGTITYDIIVNASSSANWSNPTDNLLQPRHQTDPWLSAIRQANASTGECSLSNNFCGSIPKHKSPPPKKPPSKLQRCLGQAMNSYVNGTYKGKTWTHDVSSPAFGFVGNPFQKNPTGENIVGGLRGYGGAMGLIGSVSYDLGYAIGKTCMK